MSVTHTSVGFTGTVDQVAEAKRFALAAVPFRVGSSTDWQVTAVTTANQTVQIGTGAGIAYGVRDSTSTADTVQVPPNTGSTTRYDAIVATYDWSGPSVSFGYVTGTTTPPAIKTGSTSADIDTTKINRIPGYRYDAVLAITRLAPGQGAFAASDVFDSRAFGGFAGALVIPTATYRTMVDVSPGTELLAADTGIPTFWTGSKWRGGIPLIYGTTTVDTAGYTATHSVMTLSIPDPGFSYQLQASGTVNLTVGNNVRVGAQIAVNGTLINPLGANVDGGAAGTSGLLASTWVPAVTDPMTGAATVTLTVVVLISQAASGYGFQAINDPHNRLSVLLVPA